MRTKLITALLLAGTVVGCAGNPPPPPPMAEAPPPPPPPAPVMSGPMTGMYRGTADASADLPRGCAKMTRPATVRVAPNNTFTLAGVRGMIGPDGTITSRPMRGGSLTGMASPTGLDVNVTKGKCTYHYMLAKG